MRGAPRTMLYGLEVIDVLMDARSDTLFAQAYEALHLIEVCDPRLLARIQRYLRRIVFLETGPQYWPSLDACVLHDVGSLSSAQIALLIVHEATYARLWRRGIRYSVEDRERVERVCVAAELAFVNRLPDSNALFQHTSHKLDRRWWEPESQFKRHQDDLTSIGAPAWMHKLHRLLRGPSSKTKQE